ncbi:hydroxymethylglutaryl-CoA reductase, degradative [Faecalibacter macacae]|uniref:3-hydroxy-3-methylglutaryl coenzyme A reductase n=1 Tax=Faecalibacter macacae TaxID=1859289 RepID=A0A3L9MF66_9FLAO|nr:hydroxymethylglutaryl-CoA reductase, degradative [Faecalibacter macacae]RLZ11680.1 hydroxymethylglutaryl-CoA reductase, degradative [Faecalibacter macacae]
MKHQPVEGFSKLSKEGKIEWLVNEYLNGDEKAIQTLKQYWNDDADLQKLHDEFSENTISNFYMPFGLAPNFLINDELYTIPMAVEESSVVAAASKAAKFWLDRGGFKTTVISTTKLGHVHFMYEGDVEKLRNAFEATIKAKLIEETNDITKNMRARNGGILNLELIDKTADLENYFQIKGSFETVDSMGANFINSCLEQFAKTLKNEIDADATFSTEEKDSLQIVMCILSNFTPDCIVRAEVSCPVEQLAEGNVSAEEFVEKFSRAVRIAEIEPYRATTHNKGIMNGIDSVVIATGNDFRAVEACAHSYAAKDGQYSSLTHCEVKDGIFRFWIDLPTALGTIGGLTSLHPIVKLALGILGKPSAGELMGIVAVAGLAQNFAALRSLVTTGIQKGHMKMHLMNILNQLEATEDEKKYFVNFFKDKTVTHHFVIEEFCKLRGVKSVEEIKKD